MKPERWDEVDKILRSVLERDPAERRAYLDKVCADDEELHHAVLTVMASYKEDGTFMASPVLEVSGDAFADSPKLKPGDSVGPYRIRKPIGRGGMGEVYLAEHTTQSREVALKILPEHFLDDAQRVQRFRQEARAVLALNHPNVVTVYDIGEADGIHFISTEFVEGETLRQRMARPRLTIGEAIEIAAQVAGAIAYAHEKGVIHRDVKPENIMLRPDGYVKVLDFGIAKLTERRALPADPNEAQTRMKVETSPGMVMGTPHYMSPEQARGLTVNERSDTWSLGCVLYEMLTGQQPFEGETPSDVIATILKHDPAPLRSLVPEAPPELEHILSKALDKSQDERYQTAKDFQADLRRFKRHYEHEADIERSTPPDGVMRAAAGTSPGGQQASATGTGESALSGAIAGPTTSSAEYIVAGIKQHKLATLIALVVLALGIAGFSAYWYLRNTAAEIESIAVLPFVNQNKDPDSEYLSDGVTESIINSLAQLPNLKVIARSSVFRYKGKTDPMTVGKELGVRAVLTGRIMQRGDSLTISTELVDVRENKQLWGEQYDRKVSDILVIQKQIANEISEKLRLRLTGEDRQRVAKSYTENVEAYQLYLKGNYYLQNKRTEEGLRKSIEYYNQAIKIDPNYALAYSGICVAYTSLGIYYMIPTLEAFAKAKAAAAKSLELDDKLADAHGAAGVVKLFYEWDWSICESEFKRAIDLNPNYATAHYGYAQYLAAMGRFDEAIREAKRAQELDPLSPVINTTAAWMFYFARDYDEAIKRYQKVIESDPDYFPPHRRLGVALLQKKLTKEGIAQIQKSRSLSGESAEEIAYVGYAYAVSGQRAEAEKVISELQEQAKHRYVSPYLLALIYVGLDDKDQVFVWLEKAYEDRSVNLIWLKVEPIFDGLRSDPRFAQLVARLNLPTS